jgi:hypothetical protein
MQWGGRLISSPMTSPSIISSRAERSLLALTCAPSGSQHRAIHIRKHQSQQDHLSLLARAQPRRTWPPASCSLPFGSLALQHWSSCIPVPFSFSNSHSLSPCESPSGS